MKTFVCAFLVLALSVVFAGTVPAVHSYTVTFEKAAIVNGTKLAPGDYKLTIAPDKVTLAKGKLTVDIPASVETNANKYSDTILGFNGDNLTEIRLGGTKTHVVVKQP
ncbi:MAG TPA: hypothetical protein VML19_23770 [Verrucomicrobiae bacterium]|nr:hypothetical protein [Verrucomicrobiae bacterium]